MAVQDYVYITAVLDYYSHTIAGQDYNHHTIAEQNYNRYMYHISAGLLQLHQSSTLDYNIYYTIVRYRITTTTPQQSLITICVTQ
jgi:hypothetical protein